MDTIRKTKLTFTLIIALAACLLFAFLGLKPNSAFAADENSVTPDFFSPFSKLEYYGLTSPQSAYIDENCAAIIQENTKLIVYKNDTDYAVSSYSGFTSITRVDKWNDEKLIINDYSTLYTVDLTDINAAPVPITYFDQNLDMTLPVTAEDFTLNDNYLITISGEVIKIYTVNEGVISYQSSIINAKNKTHISINSLNEIFYVSNANKLCKQTVGTELVTFIADGVTPTSMVADDNYVYFIENNAIKRVAKTGGEVISLVLSAEDFKLGTLEKPVAITIYNGNLLITDSQLAAVQEFAVTADNQLKFTGFAISKGKTAFNRADASVKDVQIYGNQVATLSANELFVTTLSDTVYDRKNYEHYKLDTLINADAFALGNGTALLINSAAKEAVLLNLKDGTTSQKITLDCNIVKGVTYQSGTYYILQLNDYLIETVEYTAYVYAYKEGADFAFTEILSVSAVRDEPTKFTVDVFGNIYMTNEYDNKIYLFEKEGNEFSKKVVSGSTADGVKKLTTDLGGNLYALVGTNVIRYNEGATTAVNLTANGASLTPLSFAMNFDSNEVYFVCEGVEIIFTTDTLGNLSIKNVAVPTEYVLTDSEANLDNVKIKTVKEGANVYSVDKGETKFNYNGLTASLATDEFLYVCDCAVGDTKLIALIGLNANNKPHTVLVNQKDLIDKASTSADCEKDKAFIATDVNAYYLPIITREDTFILTNSENEHLRLSYGTKIATQKTVTVFGRTFYYGQVKWTDNDVYAFVPVDFTTLELATADNQDVYSTATVKACKVYSDSALTNQATALDDGTKVRVYETKDGATKIAFNNGESWVIGYVDESSVNVYNSTALRNMLIIVAIALAVCGTSIYFILRKKESK